MAGVVPSCGRATNSHISKRYGKKRIHIIRAEPGLIQILTKISVFQALKFHPTLVILIQGFMTLGFA